MSVAEVFFGGTLALACLVAMASDIRQRLIPNSLCLALALAGLGYGFARAGWPGLGPHAFHMAAALAIGMALFAARWIGGGDAKFYAACAAWFPLSAAAALASLVSVAGLALVFVWFTARRLRGLPTFGKGAGAGGQLPFGVAIGLGTLAAFALNL